ncbi:AraC family transcriptional regulator [Pseudomonas sp. NPDC078700]|uniref:AraC family transcriptional regulator GliR n=1 Tax=Pseudomonas sp. NPDC078700 TaxID=3364424 RepID=UPI0037CBFC2F
MNSLGYTAAPALLKYLRHAEFLGLDADQALQAANLSREDLSDNARRIPSISHERLLSYLLQHCDDPLFGLNSARYVQPGSWSVLGYITLNCATLGEAISRIVPYEKLVGDMGVSRVESNTEHTRLIWSCRHDQPLIRRHMVENVLASWLLYARWIADTPHSPSAVLFEHNRPDGVPDQTYQDVFGCPVLFEQPCNALIIPNHLLAIELRQADSNLLRTLEEHALTLMAKFDDDQPLAARVKSALRLLLKDGLPRKERVAERFDMTVRTLQRHLQQAGTSYQSILDELRQELAEHYLLRSDLPVQDIASYLGFSESRSFHRSFKLWTGQTPGDYRHSHRPNV